MRLAALMVLLLADPAGAVTRFYFPSTTAADVAPVANGSWGYTSEELNRKLVMTTKSNTSAANGTQIGPWTAGQTAADRRYVSDPLNAQTLSGTVKCQLRAREFATNDNTTSRMELYVVNNAGSTVTGTLLAIGQYGPATEMVNSATLRNKTYADGDTISSLSINSGDRLVVVIGYIDAGGTTPEGQCNYGDPTATGDLGENETDTSGDPWIEFSASITTPTPTATATFTHTATDTETSTVTATHTATATVSGTDTATATVSGTDTATATISGTDTATATESGTFTETATVTATATISGTDTATATVSGTDTATATESGTDTATATATETVAGTDTDTATATGTASASSTATVTVQTDTATVTDTATETGTATATSTVTVTSSRTATATRTATQTPAPAPVNIPRDIRILHVNVGTFPAPVKSLSIQALPSNIVIRYVEWNAQTGSGTCTVGETVRFLSTLSPSGATWLFDLAIPAGTTHLHRDFDLYLQGTAYLSFPKQPLLTPTTTPGPDLQVIAQASDCSTASLGGTIDIYYEPVPKLFPTLTLTRTPTATPTP